MRLYNPLCLSVSPSVLASFFGVYEQFLRSKPLAQIPALKPKFPPKSPEMKFVALRPESPGLETQVQAVQAVLRPRKPTVGRLVVFRADLRHIGLKRGLQGFVELGGPKSGLSVLF